MIELILQEFLRNTLSVPVYLERPAKGLPTKFILIDHTGGGIADHIKHPVVALQCYAGSLYDAAVLADQATDAMLYEAPKLHEIGSVVLNSGPYNYTRTDSKEYRYQAVFEITHY